MGPVAFRLASADAGFHSASQMGWLSEIMAAAFAFALILS
jgi:hypothetical protein